MDISITVVAVATAVARHETTNHTYAHAYKEYRASDVEMNIECGRWVK